MSRSSFAIFYALALLALAAPAAHAQTDLRTDRGATFHRQTPVARHVQGLTRPLHTTTIQPRFLVNAVRLHAVDETGWDVPFTSDEPYAVFWDTVSGDRLFTSAFGDVDSGESRTFAVNQSCMFPIGAREDIRNGFPRFWWCNPAGRAGGVNLRVEFRESDDGSIWACARGRDAPAEPVSCQYNLIGRTNVHYTEAALVGLLPRPGDTRDFEVPIGGYTFTYRIQRVADVAVQDQPVLAPD